MESLGDICERTTREVCCENCGVNFTAVFVNGVYAGIKAYNKNESCCGGNHKVCSEECKSELEGDRDWTPIGEMYDLAEYL